MADFASKLRDARKRLKLTQHDVADRLGVSRQAVTRWERGGGVDRQHLALLVQFIGRDAGLHINEAVAPVMASGFHEEHGAGAAGSRRTLVCEIDAAALSEAEANGLDIAQLVERTIVERNRAERITRWQAANRDAIREANEELEQNGLWSDGLRLF